jgi:hypothetical protein
VSEVVTEVDRIERLHGNRWQCNTQDIDPSRLMAADDSFDEHGGLDREHVETQVEEAARRSEEQIAADTGRSRAPARPERRTFTQTSCCRSGNMR